ncbi:MAG: DUF5011 domain-containing protein [Bacteroidota bacterium]|jgi:hypothetical protein|nr:MAG: hypothetical protein DIU61_14040 [Bacteroidota bacterium]
MKKLIISTLTLLTGILFGACESDDTAHVSIVTTYPVIVLNGDEFVIAPVGTPYTEPGAVALVGEDELPVDIDGGVVVDEPGVSTIIYSATNPEGFVRSNERDVVIYDPATDVVDLSGTYVRDATGVTVTVTKIGESTYRINDAGGLGESFLDVVFVHVSEDELVVPYQVAPSSGIAVRSIPGTGVITESGFQWRLEASAVYGTAIRDFRKL